MSRKTFGIFISVLAAVVIALAGMNIAAANEKTWDVSYRMTDTRIEWAGAGYNGIYGRR